MTITGTARRDGVFVEVLPGGALRSLQLTPAALRGGGAALARTILALVRQAATQANQRAKTAIAEDIRGLREDDLTRLGLGQHTPVSEDEDTLTPERWRI